MKVMAVDPFITAPRESRPRPATQMPPAKSWWATRPGDLEAHQPQGGAFGWQGPDQGYALSLANLFEKQAVLAPGEKWPEVAYGTVGVACRRASLGGRAPIKDDLEVGFLVWGFLPAGIPPASIESLVAKRKALFADVMHDVSAQRRIVEAVPDDVLRLTPDEVRARMAAGETVVGA